MLWYLFSLSTVLFHLRMTTVALQQNLLYDDLYLPGEGISLESHPPPSTGTLHRNWRIEMVESAKRHFDMSHREAESWADSLPIPSPERISELLKSCEGSVSAENLTISNSFTAASIALTNLTSPSNYNESPEYTDNYDISPFVGNIAAGEGLAGSPWYPCSPKITSWIRTLAPFPAKLQECKPVRQTGRKSSIPLSNRSGILSSYRKLYSRALSLATPNHRR